MGTVDPNFKLRQKIEHKQHTLNPEDAKVRAAHDALSKVQPTLAHGGATARIGSQAPSYATGAPTLPDGNYQDQAQNTADLQINPQMRAIEALIGKSKSDFERGKTEATAYGDRIDPKLAEIYGALGNSLNQGTAQNKQTFTDAIGRVQQGYTDAAAKNQQLYEQLYDRIRGDAERLGTGAAITEGTSGLTEDYAYNQMTGNNAAAGRAGNMGELAAQIETLDRQRALNAGREGAQVRGDTAMQVMKAISDLANINAQETAGYRGDMAGLEADRALTVKEELARLQQQGFGNEMTIAEFNRANMESDRTFGLAEKEFGLDDYATKRQLDLSAQELSLQAQQAQADNQYRNAQLATEQRRWQAEFNEATSPEAKARARAELDKINAETESLRTESQILAQTGKGYEPGDIGMQNYARDIKANPQLLNFAYGLIDNARTIAFNGSGAVPTADQMVPRGQEGQDVATNLNLAESGNLHELALHQLRVAGNHIPMKYREPVKRLLNVYYKGVGG